MQIGETGSLSYEEFQTLYQQAIEQKNIPVLLYCSKRILTITNVHLLNKYLLFRTGIPVLLPIQFCDCHLVIRQV